MSIKYSNNKELRELEKFAFKGGYQIYYSFIHHVSISDAIEFKKSISDLSKEIRSVIKHNQPRSKIVKATEDVLGIRPSFAYPTDDEDACRKYTRDYIVEVLSGKAIDYIPNDEVSEEELLKNINNDRCGDRVYYYKYKGYLKYHEYPWVTSIADVWSSDSRNNVWGAAYWLSNHYDTYRGKITSFQALLYACYRLDDELKCETDLSLTNRILLINIFKHRNMLANSLNYDSSNDENKEVV